MTQDDRDRQHGEVIRRIREQENLLAPLLVRAQSFGDLLATVAQSFQRQLGVRKIGNKYSGWVSGSHAVAGYELVLNLQELMKLEDEIRAVGRELDRLYGQRSQLDLDYE